MKSTLVLPVLSVLIAVSAGCSPSDEIENDVATSSETPTSAPASPEVTVTREVDVIEGVLTAELPSSWDVRDFGGLTSSWTEPEIGEPIDFDTDDLDLVAGADHTDGSQIDVLEHFRPLRVRQSLAELGAALREGVDPNRRGTELAFGPAELGGADAFEYVVETDDRTISWYLFRVQDRLLAVVGVERGGADVASVIASMAVDPDGVPPVSHFVRIETSGVAGADSTLRFRVPADVEVADDGSLESASLDIRAEIIRGNVPIDEVRSAAVEQGDTVTTSDVDGVPATVIDRVGDAEVTRRVVLSRNGGGWVEIRFVVGPHLVGVLDEMSASLSLS